MKELVFDKNKVTYTSNVLFQYFICKILPPILVRFSWTTNDSALQLQNVKDLNKRTMILMG